MKLRIGFVTNSSSSSFTIAKSDLTDDQIEKIKNHIKVAKELEMETFYMEKFLLSIGVAREDVEWED